MSELDITGLPDKLVETAIRSYRFNSGASYKDKLRIHYWCQRQEIGDFSLSVSEDSDSITATLELDGESYDRRKPKYYEDFEAEIYPIGNVRFERAELIAVSATGGFPWTTESFNAWYLGDMNEESIDQEGFEDMRILQQYYPPREVTSEPPECTLTTDDRENAGNFMVADIRNATHCKEPNPWSYASFAVLYENEEIATDILNGDGVYGEPDNYSLTPPQPLNQSFVNFS